MPDREKVTGMVDREKVIRGLELCAYDPDPGQELKEVRSCPECPYYRAGCSPQLIRDALALLKEQDEGIEPEISLKSVTETTASLWYKCGACGEAIEQGDDKFCRHCGRKVKWDD